MFNRFYLLDLDTFLFRQTEMICVTSEWNGNKYDLIESHGVHLLTIVTKQKKKIHMVQ